MSDFKEGDVVIHIMKQETGSKTNKTAVRISEFKGKVLKVFERMCLVKYENSEVTRKVKKKCLKLAA